MMTKKSIRNRKVRTSKTQEQPPNRWLTTMETRPMNRSLRAPGKLAENKPSLPEKSKPTGGMHERGGPKTAAGKRRVSRNAIKHGFFSNYRLGHHRDGKESQREYDD